jgi:5'-methylthioadenosine phosphorylase
MVTDYDCWREGHDDVTVEQVVAVIHQNSENAGKVVRAAVAKLPTGVPSPFAEALKFAIMTDKTVIPESAKEKLGLLIGKYL